MYLLKIIDVVVTSLMDSQLAISTVPPRQVEMWYCTYKHAPGGISLTADCLSYTIHRCHRCHRTDYWSCSNHGSVIWRVGFLPSRQKGHWGTGACSRMANEADKMSRKHIFWGTAEGTRVVLSGEEEAQGGPHRSLQLPERRLYPGGGLFSSAMSQVTGWD